MNLPKAPKCDHLTKATSSHLWNNLCFLSPSWIIVIFMITIIVAIIMFIMAFYHPVWVGNVEEAPHQGDCSLSLLHLCLEIWFWFVLCGTLIGTEGQTDRQEEPKLKLSEQNTGDAIHLVHHLSE